MAKARSMVVTEDDNSILEVPSTSGYENRVMSNVHIPDSNDVVLESRHSSTYVSNQFLPKIFLFNMNFKSILKYSSSRIACNCII